MSTTTGGPSTASPDLSTPHQASFEELGTPLHAVTFVVVDLETTGGSPANAGITEIGAVKVLGGEVLGEFQTLVNPGMPVPAFVARLTGITTAMTVDAPPIEAVLPSFWEFARGAVLVAHNAPFDVGFLRAATVAAGFVWPAPQVVDTVPLARRAVTRDEVPNHKLSTLAGYFRARVSPEHRALADARATVDVLHGIFDRLAPLGVTHLEDLATAADPVAPEVRRKRHLADGLPEGPGVYLFTGPDGEVLYVGTSRTVRRRVRSYFTAAEKRRRISEMVRVAEAVRAVPCATTLEAQVREIRLITEHEPRYNRRSTRPERGAWLRLTDEPYPRPSVVRDVRGQADGSVGTYIGPFASRRTATEAMEALCEAIPVRQCTSRLPRRAGSTTGACLLADLGRCSAPCVAVEGDPGYGDAVDAARSAMTEDPRPVVDALGRRIRELSAQTRFEEASEVTRRLREFLAGAARTQRLGTLATCSQIVAARPTTDRGWEVVVVRYGRFAGTTVVPAGTHPGPAIDALVATAERVDAPTAPAPACHPHEAAIVGDWLESPGVRVVQIDGTWALPVRSAVAYGDLSAALPRAPHAAASLAPAG
ncbi:DNA polymerase-3 subunit epsilon [Paraoerskovia marina]|uniref:DNA polymerase-3 subunit epsilon n=1 Tax=Paraoerskovia marina TaxID=545619 RepID=A0A1H1SAI9_9CELL|nr:DEDD exonuclease domain-containing protein [Paraoerskovia marina]SDS44339.1 DNA polymerase-3 subunit epsilon [Paraoerskovia marina]